MKIFHTCLMLLVSCVSASANAGWGGFTATGLEFQQTDEVTLIEEELRIGMDRITVEYVFLNVTKTDVTGEVIFPLPPVYQPEGYHFPGPTPAPESLVDFTLHVAGQKVEADVDIIAVIRPRWTDETPLSDVYDAPGRDVTAELRRFGIPLTFDSDRIEAALLALSDDEAWDASKLGLVTYRDFGIGKSDPDELSRMWSLVVRHHWTQTFPAGEEVRVSISYRNVMPGGLFDWEFLRASGDAEDFDKAFCLDSRDVAEIAKLFDEPNKGWLVGATEFVLRTANSWAGPIGRFRLIIDKSEPGNVAATCLDGISQNGPTTLLWEATNFIPENDLLILFVYPFVSPTMP
jgi:hypothetical protein